MLTLNSEPTGNHFER